MRSQQDKWGRKMVDQATGFQQALLNQQKEWQQKMEPQRNSPNGLGHVVAATDRNGPSLAQAISLSGPVDASTGCFVAKQKGGR